MNVMLCVYRVGSFAARCVHPRGVGVARRGRGLKAAAGEKGRTRVLPLERIRRVAGAGYAVARLGAVIILAAKSKKNGFSAKKNTKNAPRRIKTRPRAFIYHRTRVFCLPSARGGAYIAGIMATRALKTAPKTAATSATAAELVPVAKRKRGGQIGNRNGVGHGRPRGRSENAYVVKLNIAISRAQRERLENAAQNAGVKYTDFLRNLIDSL